MLLSANFALFVLIFSVTLKESVSAADAEIRISALFLIIF